MTSDLVDRIRGEIGGDPNIGEIRMFGGTCFTLNGNMLCGTMKGGDFLVRVGEHQDAAALSRPGASRMNLTGREMKGFVIVAANEVDDEALKSWLAMASAFVGPMPPKKKKK